MACASRPCASATKVIERSTTARMMHRMSSRGLSEAFSTLFRLFSQAFSGLSHAFQAVSRWFWKFSYAFQGAKKDQYHSAPQRNSRAPKTRSFTMTSPMKKRVKSTLKAVHHSLLYTSHII